MSMIHPRIFFLMLLGSALPLNVSHADSPGKVDGRLLIDRILEIGQYSNTPGAGWFWNRPKVSYDRSRVYWHDIAIQTLEERERQDEAFPASSLNTLKCGETNHPCLSIGNAAAREKAGLPQYDGILVGPTQEFSRQDGGFTHWRLITFYYIKKDSAPIHGLHALYEKCNDAGWRGGSWAITHTVDMQINTKVGAELVGLEGKLKIGGEIQSGSHIGKQQETFLGTNFTLGVQARHVPTLTTDTWYGSTYVQVLKPSAPVFDKNKGFVQYMMLGLIQPTEGQIKDKSYPVAFKLTGQNATFSAVRTDEVFCSNYDPKNEGAGTKGSKDNKILFGGAADEEQHHHQKQHNPPHHK